MMSFPREELEALMIERTQNWHDNLTRRNAALISSRIILTKKKNQKQIAWANKKYPELYRALLLEKEKNNEYFNRNVKRAMLSIESDADGHNRDADGHNSDADDRNSDEDDRDADDCNSNANSIPLFVKGLELLKKKSGSTGYHGRADQLVGLGKYCQGETLLLVTHSMKHFSLKPPVDDVFDLSSLFYPEDVDAAPVALVYTIIIDRPVLFIK
jgi:hypothetical protein